MRAGQCSKETGFGQCFHEIGPIAKHSSAWILRCAECDRLAGIMTGMMKFTLMINGGPYASQGAATAYGFAAAALAQGHEVPCIFFYGDGVYNALSGARPPGDEPQFLQRWQALAAQYDVNLVVCSAAAERRGVLGSAEEEGYAGVAEGFTIGGLGLWVDACLAADRVLVFHG